MKAIRIVRFGIVLVAFAALMASVVPAGATTVILTCDGKVPTITGAGEIHGTSGHDVIIGSAGDDVIYGSSGHDTICGEGGNDVLYGGSGNDRMWGEVQGRKDALDGEPGVDQLFGDSGGDLLVDFSSAEQYFEGGSGSDRILAAGTVVANSGNDDVTIGDLGGSIDGGSGTDTCAGTTDFVSCEAVP